MGSPASAMPKNAFPQRKGAKTEGRQKQLLQIKKPCFADMAGLCGLFFFGIDFAI
jgi:hypothetical protein